MRIIVTGMIATFPVGGVAWDYGQYALGLEALGHEVYYLEDTGSQTYDPTIGYYTDDCSYGVDFLRNSLSTLSPTLGDRWHFRSLDGRSYGLDPARLAEIAASADLFLNVSGSALLRDDYLICGCKVLIDTDPGWNHFVNFPRWDESPGWHNSHGWRAHDHFFTYAEGINLSDCVLPDFGLTWRTTRPPVMMGMWAPEPPGARWTTVMTWNTFRQPMEHAGVVYGTKELEFPKFETLPAKASAEFELAVGGPDPPAARWRTLGWSVVSSEEISRTVNDYQSYIQRSRGEFSVAKNVYVDTRSGWFSCRSVCYLAAGRPVVVQDTGFSEHIATGEGLFAFRTMSDAVDSVRMAEANYALHSKRAVEIAEAYFAAPLVLNQLISEVG